MTHLSTAIITDWEAYNCVFSAEGGGASAGNGVMLAFWRRLGHTVEVLVRFNFGTTTNTGSGPFNLSLPPGIKIDLNKLNTGFFLGPGFNFSYGDTERIYYIAIARSASTLGAMVNGTDQLVSATVPIVWGSGHRLILSARFPLLRDKSVFFLPDTPQEPDPDSANILIYPLTYDEDDSNGANTLTRFGGLADHVTPLGVEGDGYTARYTNTTLPVWATSPTNLTLQATTLVESLPKHATRDVIAMVGENDATANPFLELAVVQDVENATADPDTPAIAVRGYTGTVQSQILSRNTWKFHFRYPVDRVGVNPSRPQGFLFLDADTVIWTAHYNNTESRVYRIRLSDGYVTGFFTFGLTANQHVASVAKSQSGSYWFLDFNSGHALEVDLDASFDNQEAVILTDWDTSNITGLSSLEFITVGGTDYVVIGEYLTAGTAYQYVIPTTEMGAGTFQLADRFKRFNVGLRVQGATLEGAGTFVIARSEGMGVIERYDFATAIQSEVDGATLTPTSSVVGPGRLLEDLDLHPSTGDVWTSTEGYESVGDVAGWNALWSSPTDETPQENRYTLNYNNSLQQVEVWINERLFDRFDWALTANVQVLSIGGPPAATAGVQNGFFAGFVSNVALKDTLLNSTERANLADGSFEANTLTTYTVTITNPGAETGDTTGWTDEVGGLDTRTSNPAPYEGGNYFFGGPNVQTIARQRFDLTTITGLSGAQIDAADLWGKVRWWQAAFNAADPGAIGIRYLDGVPAEISIDYAGIEYMIPEHVWFRRAYGVDVPSGARNVDIVIRADRTDGTNNDAYFDSLEMVIYQR